MASYFDVSEFLPVLNNSRDAIAAYLHNPRIGISGGCDFDSQITRANEEEESSALHRD